MSAQLAPVRPGDEEHARVSRTVREMMRAVPVGTSMETLFSSLLGAFCEVVSHVGMSCEDAQRAVGMYFEHNFVCKDN